jgi:hypothetical protein
MSAFRLRKQLTEAFGPVNQWYCSQAHGRPVHDPEALLRHFIRSGGAADFAERFEHAMSPLNRWYCSEFHGHEIRDPELLWNYYMSYRLAASGDASRRPTRDRPRDNPAPLSIAS